MNKALLFGLVALLAIAGTTQASVITVPMTDNAGWNYYPEGWGSWDANKSNFNDSTYLFKRFQAADLSGAVSSAYLTMNVADMPAFSENDGVANGGSFLDIYAVTTDWSSALPHSAFVGSFVTSADSANFVGGVLTIDVTAAVQGWQASGQQFGFAFQSRLPGGGINNWTNDFNYIPPSMTLTVETTPEPVTMALLAIGGIGMLARRRASR